MSIRIITLCLIVAGLGIYAWKDWFFSLCGLILMMALMNHDDMPRSILGIPGLSIWNGLFIVVAIAWMVSRQREGLRWDLPHHVSLLLWLSLAVIVWGFLRAVLDRGNLGGYSIRNLVNEELINSIKWFLPALLLYDGCRTRRRLIGAIACVLAMYTVIAVLVIKRIPLEALWSFSDGIVRTRHKLNRTIGYHAVDISAILAGAFWAGMAVLQPIRKRLYQVVLLGTSSLVCLGMALTGGRGGYLAWASIALTMCLLKWRKLLILVPVFLVLVPVVLPGPTARMLQGLGATDVSGSATIDLEAVGSGRFLVWPLVISEIGKAPLVGYGRLAMKRTELDDRIEAEFPGTRAPHPHNMYLEFIFDNGILGAIPVFLFWAIAVVYSSILFRSCNPLYSAIGGAALAAMLAQLFGGLTGQHLYPGESSAGTYALMFLMLRVYVEESRAKAGAISDHFNQQILPQ